MKILLLELSGSDSCSKRPSRYGGVGSSLRKLAENIDNCFLAAQRDCFEGDENDKCIPLNGDSIVKIRDYHGSVEEIIRYRNHLCEDPEPPPFDFDVIVYANPSIVLNTKKPQLCWAVGQNEEINPEIKHLLLHDKIGQNPLIQNNETKIYEFILGIDIPPFEIYQKQDFIVQVTNHYPQINSVLLASLALKYKIKTIFAGPISSNYPLLDLIDYETTFHIGQIKEEEKIKLLKKAKLAASLYSFPINGPPLFTKQSLSYGCGFLTTHIPSMEKIIKNGENGFLIQNEQELVDAWNNRDKINQRLCWETANNWSLDKMVKSFVDVVEKVAKI